MAYNEYYLNSQDQQTVFDCLDNIEYICKDSYNWEDELNREFLSGVVDVLQEQVDILNGVVNKR